MLCTKICPAAKNLPGFSIKAVFPPSTQDIVEGASALPFHTFHRANVENFPRKVRFYREICNLFAISCGKVFLPPVWSVDNCVENVEFL